MRARKWIGFTYKRALEDTTLSHYIGLLKNRKKNAKLRFFTSRGTYVNNAIITMLYTHLGIITNNNNCPPACTSAFLWDRKQGIKQ